MPHNRFLKPVRIAQLGTGPLRAPRPEPQPPNPHQPPPIWVFLLAAIALSTAVAIAWVWIRRRAYRAWKGFAAAIGGEFRSDDNLSPRLVSGEFRGRPLILETATSHEDEAGYYHTRGRAPLKNIGSFILGLRRKSLLEAAQTRNQPSPFFVEDPDFERQFFLYCNDSDNLPAVLTPEARRELLRYHDVEIYVRMGEMEWRRAGEQSDVRVIERLTNLLIDMADTIDGFPSRGRSLTQVLADERMIEKGV